MVRYLITKLHGIHILSNLNVAEKAVIGFGTSKSERPPTTRQSEFGRHNL